MRVRLVLAALLFTIGLSIGPAQATRRTRSGATLTSLIGEPKYPPDFKHFDYVNPDAPKGGVVRLSDTGGFDTLNPDPVEGQSGARPRLRLRNADDASARRALDDVRADREAISCPTIIPRSPFGCRPEAK